MRWLGQMVYFIFGDELDQQLRGLEGFQIDDSFFVGVEPVEEFLAGASFGGIQTTKIFDDSRYEGVVSNFTQLR